MKYITFMFFICLIGAVGCEKNATDPVGKPIAESIIEFANELDIQLIYYDSIQVKTKYAFHFNSKEITKIEIGQKSESQFHLLKTIIPQYMSNQNGYSLILQTGLSIDPGIIDLELAVLLYSSKFQFYELDTLIHMYKYPYSDCEIFITYDDIFRYDTSGYQDVNVQDFDFKDSIMFVHAMGVHGIISINTRTLAYNQVLPVAIGGASTAWNYLTYGNESIFFEGGGYILERLNLKTDSVDLRFNLSNLNYTNINGLDFYADILYVFMETGQPENNYLAQFDMNGNYLGSIPYPRSTWYMAIADNILYSIGGYGLSRFDLTTNTFIESVIYPCKFPDGIRVKDNFFYYTDYDRRFIARIKLSDFN